MVLKFKIFYSEKPQEKEEKYSAESCVVTKNVVDNLLRYPWIHSVTFFLLRLQNIFKNESRLGTILICFQAFDKSTRSSFSVLFIYCCLSKQTETSFIHIPFFNETQLLSLEFSI